MDLMILAEYQQYWPFGAIGTGFIILLIFLKQHFKKTESKKLTKVILPAETIETKPSSEEVKKDFNQRLKLGLSKSRQSVWGKIKLLITGKKIDQETRDHLESILYQADISTTMVEKILVEVENQSGEEDITTKIKKLMSDIFQKVQPADIDLRSLEIDWQNTGENTNKLGLQVIMIVGVNGVGKTTTVGKLAAGLSRSGKKVVVAAADTFRAAAKEQLQVWCDRANAELITGHENNQDPAAVCYQAVAKAIELNADYCLLDTAGRLHNNDQLMEELKKIKRVISKLVPSAPHETLIVLDAMTGQNALKQAVQFKTSLEGLTGVVLTKCDGSAKAGCALAIVEQLGVPIRFIGVGETLDDLNIFRAQDFISALMNE